MTEHAERFAQLLTEGIHRIRRQEGKSVSAIQDELGYELGREGGSAIEYWRKGHVPVKVTEVVALAKVLVRRGKLDREWLEQFLTSAGLPQQDALCQELFLAGAPPQSLAQGLSQISVASPPHKPLHQDWGDALSLQIYLLGGFQLFKDDLPILVNQARQQLLLSYLLVHRHIPQSRQHLSFLVLAFSVVIRC